MRPYYDADGVTIYCGDCRAILPALDLAPALVLTDPPYGIRARTDNRYQQRSRGAQARDYAPVHGDATPFDPSHLLGYPRVVLFGANHYADKLPPSPAWLVWDKLDGLTGRRAIGFNDQADAELAWTNLDGTVRLLSHRWMGMVKASEQGERRVHPTQKPVELMRRIIAHWTEPGDLILDPYTGSGTTLRAAKDLGRRAIGIEVEEPYCEIAARRMEQTVLDLGGAA